MALRLIRENVAQTQRNVLAATCGARTELGVGERIDHMHAGEDGDILVPVQERFFDIDSQHRLCDMQDWYFDELLSQVFF